MSLQRGVTYLYCGDEVNVPQMFIFILIFLHQFITLILRLRLIYMATLRVSGEIKAKCIQSAIYLTNEDP